MLRRRQFLTTALSAIGLSSTRAARAAEQRLAPQLLEPLVWPLVGGEQPGIRTFAGHANTVLDIVGRIGAPPSLVIYTEGRSSHGPAQQRHCRRISRVGQDATAACASQPRQHRGRDLATTDGRPDDPHPARSRSAISRSTSAVLPASFPTSSWAGPPRSENCVSWELSSRRLATSREIAVARCSSVRAIPSAFTALPTWRAWARASRRRIRSRPVLARATAPRSKR